jgi:hypothetical protein
VATRRHIVIVPKTTLGNWCKEFARWYPQLRVLRLAGSKDERALLREVRPRQPTDDRHDCYAPCAVCYWRAVAVAVAVAVIVGASGAIIWLLLPRCDVLMMADLAAVR